MTKRSRMPYEETVNVLRDAIGQGGNTIFASIDQSAAAQSAGMTLRPTTLLIFGNPKGGTPLMDAYPLVGLELPLKLLVWEEDGVVALAYSSMSEIAVRYGITGMDTRIQALDRAIDSLVQIVA